MNLAAIHMAKKKALGDLISQMRRMEMADKAEDASEGPSAHGGMGEGEVLEPDMSDMESEKLPEVGMEGGESADEEDALAHYMKHGSKMKPSGRVTVAISAMKGPKSPMPSFGKGRRS